MSAAKGKLDRPNLAKGIALAQIADGTLLSGHARGESVALASQRAIVIGASCTSATVWGSILAPPPFP